MTKVLFITNPAAQCGVHEYCKRTLETLTRSTRLDVSYREMPHDTSPEQLEALVHEVRPEAIIYNYHPLTMSWLTDDVVAMLVHNFPRLRQIGFAHDRAPRFPHLHAVIHLDPTAAQTTREFPVPRPMPSFTPRREPLTNVIGSFGLGAGHKGFARVIDHVNAEFERATIRLHIPFGHYGDPDGKAARRIAQECRDRAKPGITVDVTHDYKTETELLEWLSENTLNCFFYDRLEGAGISSALDLAVAARRPVALTDSVMFRHVTGRVPGTLIQNQTLQQIIQTGFAPLEQFHREWSEDSLRQRYEEIIAAVMQPASVDLTSNRVLMPADREALRPAVAELTRLCPDIMSRKIPEAVFQNAFLYEQVKRFASLADDIILIGGFEDPIGPALRALGFQVTITDPALDGKSAHDVWLEAIHSGRRYDIVVSCSVIEHVADDGQFVQQLYQLLKPGGVALLTTDFNADWRPHMRPAAPDSRLYTPERLQMLAKKLPAESLLSPPTWAPTEAYFDFHGVRYSFCSLAFRKPVRSAVGEDTAARLLAHAMQAKLNSLRRLREQLARYRDVQDVGPSTLHLVGRMHRLTTRFPRIKRSLKGLLNLTRIFRRAG
jgi:SAM-dependent methyltransferase